MAQAPPPSVDPSVYVSQIDVSIKPPPDPMFKSLALTKWARTHQHVVADELAEAREARTASALAGGLIKAQRRLEGLGVFQPDSVRVDGYRVGPDLSGSGLAGGGLLGQAVRIEVEAVEMDVLKARIEPSARMLPGGVAESQVGLEVEGTLRNPTGQGETLTGSYKNYASAGVTPQPRTWGSVRANATRP